MQEPTSQFLKILKPYFSHRGALLEFSWTLQPRLFEKKGRLSCWLQNGENVAAVAGALAALNAPAQVTDAIGNLEAIVAEVIPALRLHPVPQSDPRSKGLIVHFTKNSAGESFAALPVLYSFIQPRLKNGDAEYILAVNQTPPTCSEDFAMRPHIDRRWQGSEFQQDAPVWTSVMFLYFPSAGKGGELVVFEHNNEQQMQALNALDRAGGRRLLSQFSHHLVAPLPGRICRFRGNLPHAVLGYSSEAGNEKWRLTIVFAEFR